MEVLDMVEMRLRGTRPNRGLLPLPHQRLSPLPRLRKLLDERQVDWHAISLQEIPPNHIWPQTSSNFTVVPPGVVGDCYVKFPALGRYRDQEDPTWVSQHFLQEASTSEILLKNPHNNIAQYHGCIVENGRIKGLCFTEYSKILAEVRSELSAKEKEECMKRITSSVQHLHELGLVHNHLQPSNIMIDNGGNPVLTNFEWCTWVSEDIEPYSTPFNWSNSGLGIAEKANDGVALEKIFDWFTR
ncbi:MAG: hypothetical protein M1831_001303 [Alyxoria varia]|nr:MAG: hypothetical protein M1831_001303 [Alyxoria varia]